MFIAFHIEILISFVFEIVVVIVFIVLLQVAYNSMYFDTQSHREF